MTAVTFEPDKKDKFVFYCLKGPLQAFTPLC
jgi:hypothetical protein